MPARNKARTRDIGNHQKFHTKFCILQSHLLLNRARKGVGELEKALWKTVASDEEVPDIDAKHA